VAIAVLVLLFSFGLRPLVAKSSIDPLQRDFASPPDSAKPRVWWHWMNGNITREGIKLDLDWMSRIGIGGMQTFDAAFDTPQLVDQRLVFMTPLWNDAFRYAANIADQSKLELAIAGSPGWSESGGPWVKPEDGMKKLVWAETPVVGGARFKGVVLRPPTIVGPFQDISVFRDPNSFAGTAPVERVPDLYKDVALIAYRVPANDYSMRELHPQVISSAGEIDAELLWDGHLNRSVHLPSDPQLGAAWIRVDFGRPQTVQSMVLGLQQPESTVYRPPYTGAELQASDDGVNFNRVANAYDSTEYTTAGLPPAQQTVTFPPATARYFRLLLTNPPKWNLSPSMAAVLVPADDGEQKVTEFVLSPVPRVDHLEQKAGYFLDTGVHAYPTRHISGQDVIHQSQYIDLTSRLHLDGTLDWTPPAGRWRILRMGCSLTGATNRPASPEGTGLEVDKLSRSAVSGHMKEYLDRYEAILGANLIGSHGLRAMVNDSYEAGAQNWTDDMPSEFARRRGYDLHPWLPALAGRIVESAEATDKFIWDFRRTLGELIAENHYGQISTILHSRGMIHYGESHEVGRAFIGDGMDAKRDDDIPMAAMWVTGGGLGITQENGDADIHESASVSHIYGQNIVAAESMTAFGTPGVAFAFAPEDLKPTVDRELADGLNLFVIHTSAHQPLVDKAPGVTLGPFGQWFTRNETWAEQATPWIKYLSRSSYLLQQGHFVADVIYYYGQDSNITALYGKHLPSIPEGYAFDFASPHALKKLEFRDGFIVAVSGAKYRVIVLDPRATLMSLDVLKTVAHLVQAGATVVGDKPQATPSLSDDPAEFTRLSGLLWGDGSVGEHKYGQGRILTGHSLVNVFRLLKIEPDFQYSKSHSDSDVRFVHRRLEDGDIYFINNRKARSEELEARFRITDEEPELWHADTGVIESVSYREDAGRTLVPLTLDANDAVFVVFRKASVQHERRVPAYIRESLHSLNGPWTVHFQQHRGAPAEAEFKELQSWTLSGDPGIRYFSGTATYETTFEVPSRLVNAGASIEIDLGAVKNVAEVFVNGIAAGIAWKAPFRLEVTNSLHAGTNKLSVRVTNVWQNRLIGDKQSGATSVAITTLNPYTADSPLLPSGLLGPVKITRVQRAAN